MSNSTKELDLSVYTKKNYTLIITAVVVNIVIIGLVFSGVIQNFVTSLFYIKLFDYYTTYIVLLGIFNVYISYKYVGNVSKKASLTALLEAKEKGFDLKQVIIISKGNEINLGDLLGTKDLELEDNFLKKTEKDIPEDVLKFLEDKSKEYSKQMFNVDYIPNLLIVLFLVAGIVSLLFGRISVNNFVSQYENKYKKIEFELKDKEEKKQVKEKIIAKLEDLKNKYINEFGSGSDVVKQIDNDILKLTTE